MSLDAVAVTSAAFIAQMVSTRFHIIDSMDAVSLIQCRVSSVLRPPYASVRSSQGASSRVRSATRPISRCASSECRELDEQRWHGAYALVRLVVTLCSTLSATPEQVLTETAFFSCADRPDRAHRAARTRGRGQGFGWRKKSQRDRGPFPISVPGRIRDRNRRRRKLQPATLNRDAWPTGNKLLIFK